MKSGIWNLEMSVCRGQVQQNGKSSLRVRMSAWHKNNDIGGPMLCAVFLKGNNPTFKALL
jgi:hypothetical protein